VDCDVGPDYGHQCDHHDNDDHHGALEMAVQAVHEATEILLDMIAPVPRDFQDMDQLRIRQSWINYGLDDDI
jgi:hypothetical protein